MIKKDADKAHIKSAVNGRWWSIIKRNADETKIINEAKIELTIDNC